MEIGTYLLIGLTILGINIALNIVSRLYIRKTPALAEARAYNLAEDKKRMAMDKYPPVVKQNHMFGLFMFFPLLLLITPLFASFDPLPWWRYVTDILLIFIVYDFLYYLTHRFLFHGNFFGGYFKRVHGLHHQARNPSHIDSQYVHPVETFIGLLLLYITVIGLGIILGGFNVFSIAVGYFIYTQLNILNHVDLDLSEFPYTMATWMSKKHHVHHENMGKGNYATIILLYDKMFGTLD